MSKPTIQPLWEGLAIALVTLIAIGVNIYWTYQRAREAVQEEIREGLLRTVMATARMMDGRLGDEHKRFHPIERIGNCDYAAHWKRLQNDQEFIAWRAATMATPAYQEWKQRMEEVRKSTKYVRWMYTCVLESDHVYFAFNEALQNDIADNITGDPQPDGLLDPAPNLLWPYPDAGESQIKALKEGIALVDALPYTDLWGTYYSAYAPFFDSSGKMVGTLGMDLETIGLPQRMIPVVVASKRAAMTGFCVAILSGVVVWFVRRLCAQLWIRSDGAGGERQDVASLQNAQSAYAAGLLETFYRGNEGADQLANLHRIVESGREAGTEAPANFLSADLATLMGEHMASLGSRAEVTLDAEVPDILYAAPQRLARTVADCLEGCAGADVTAAIGMKDEKIQWLTLVVRFSRVLDGQREGSEGEIDLLAENRVALASAQASARALRGSFRASRHAGRMEMVLEVPVRKSQTQGKEA